MQISPIKRRKAARNKPSRPVSAGKLAGGGAVVIDIVPYLHEKELLELGKKAVRKIAAALNVKPLYVSLHLDEKTPHLHYQLENLNRETGRTVA